MLLCEDEADLQLLLAEAAFATARQEAAMDRGPSRLWVCPHGCQSHARETSGHEAHKAVCFGLSARVSLGQTPRGTQTPRALAAADVPPSTSKAAARTRVRAWLPGGLWGQKVTSSGPLCPQMMRVYDQSHLTLCDPMDYNPPGSSVHGILQTRILEWAAILFSRGSSRPRD